MTTKILYRSLIFVSIFLFACCDPLGEPLCGGSGGDVIVDDLVTVTPLQTSYQQGDSITIRTNIPNINNYFGLELNMIAATYDPLGSMTFGSIQVLTDQNEVIIEKGLQGDAFNHFELPYNPETGNFELELRVKLNRVGAYSFHTGNSEVFFLKGNDPCNTYTIGTNFQGRDENNIFSFTVE